MTYTTVSGDTWDLIALKIYGDEKYAEYLMAQNQSEELLETVIFDAGTTINAPDLPQAELDPDSAPPWRTS